MNNKGFAITTILYGTLILFSLLLVSMLGILSTYRENLEKLIDSDNAARDIVTMEKNSVSNFEDADNRGLYCVGNECKYISTVWVKYYNSNGTGSAGGNSGDNSSGNTSTIEKVVIPYEKIKENYSCSNKTGGSAPIFTYTGKCELIDDKNGNWRIKFYEGGDLTFSEKVTIDVFLVGGGGGGNNGDEYGTGGAGAGGYTTTEYSFNLDASKKYSIVVGAGGKVNGNGGTSSAFGFTASGGGKGGSCETCNGSGGSGAYAAYGADGKSSGQGSTTCEFEQSKSGSKTDTSGCASGVTAYSGGGIVGYGGPYAGGGCKCEGGSCSSGTANTGGGGCGYYQRATKGGSGIVIIRNAR